MSPTQRTLDRLRESGWLAAIVEKHSPHGGRPIGSRCAACGVLRFTGLKHDLYGFADVLAVKPGRTLAVQTTSGSNMAARATKMLGVDCRDAVAACLAAGWKLEIHGWAKGRSDELRKDGSRSTRIVSKLRRMAIVQAPEWLRVELLGETEDLDPAEAIEKEIEQAF